MWNCDEDRMYGDNNCIHVLKIQGKKDKKHKKCSSEKKQGGYRLKEWWKKCEERNNRNIEKKLLLEVKRDDSNLIQWLDTNKYKSINKESI